MPVVVQIKSQSISGVNIVAQVTDAFAVASYPIKVRVVNVSDSNDAFPVVEGIAIPPHDDNTNDYIATKKINLTSAADVVKLATNISRITEKLSNADVQFVIEEIAIGSALDTWVASWKQGYEWYGTEPAFVLLTVSDLYTVSIINSTVFVKDTLRGGVFDWLATGTANGGTVFSGVTGYWVRRYSGAVNALWFGCVGDGVTDDSSAFSAALLYITKLIKLSPEYLTNELYLPTGSYLLTVNNILGAGIYNNSGYTSKLIGPRLTGDGQHQTIIKFRPSISDGVMYDQTIQGTLGIMGIYFDSLGLILEDTGNGGQPVHFIKSKAVASQASQNFSFTNFRAKGTPTSIFLQLLGDAINESELTFHNLKLLTFKTIIRNENYEAVNHAFYWCDFTDMYGHVFDYVRGGCLNVYGGNILFSSLATNEAAILAVGQHDGSISGQTSQFYNFNGVRAELRGVKSRVLYMEAPIEAQIFFESCGIFANQPNLQAFAKVPVQHRANITFKKCVFPKRVIGFDTGTVQLTDSLINTQYATTNAVTSIIKFEDCNYAGDRVSDTLPYVDFSYLTSASLNFRSIQIVYKGCDGIPDSVEYGQSARMGRTFSNNVPSRLIFRGEELPKGDGTNPVYDLNSFNTVVPLNNYLSEIHVSRPAVGSITDPYVIEFVDSAEWTTYGAGVIFGETTSQAANLKINATVAINKIFTGTREQRTIWCRLKTGVTVTLPGRVNDGATIWADVM